MATFSPSTMCFGVVCNRKKRGGNCEDRVSLASQEALQLLAQVTPSLWSAGLKPAVGGTRIKGGRRESREGTR